jgi:Fe2+ transport system protein FeoA
MVPSLLAGSKPRANVPPEPRSNIILKMSEPSPHLTLSALEPGDRAVVRAVDASEELGRRLLEMGFVTGTELRVVRVAPFGDPMEVTLHGYHVSLRRRDAGNIAVERS